MRNAIVAIFVLAAGLPVLGGCAAGSRRNPPWSAKAGRQQDVHAARKLNAAGLASVEKGDFNRAERQFREAVEADLYYAPAHNNLGLALVRSGDFYEAAWEFQTAAKMMPHSPEPTTNLGMLYEKLGRLDPAIEEYEAALKIDPDNMTAMRQAARVYVKTGSNENKLKDTLEKMLSCSEGGQWDYWARGQLVRLDRDD